MKVIFLQDVPSVARAGEIKKVADGYGRNYLLPQKLAVLATPSANKLAEALSKKRAARQLQTEAELAELARQLEDREVILKAKAGAKDHLFGSITSADIAAEINDTLGLNVDKRRVELAEPIRQLGSYEVTVRLTRDAAPKIKVTVIPETTE